MPEFSSFNHQLLRIHHPCGGIAGNHLPGIHPISGEWKSSYIFQLAQQQNQKYATQNLKTNRQYMGFGRNSGDFLTFKYRQRGKPHPKRVV
jgi:hypothetical protein